MAEPLFLNCFIDDEVYEVDIDTINKVGKWRPYSTNSFSENADDPQYRLNISSNNVALIGKKPFDYIEIDLNTLLASAKISLSGGMNDDDLSGGMDDDDLSGGMNDDDLSGGMNDDDLSGGMNDDDLSGGMASNYCVKISSR